MLLEMFLKQGKELSIYGLGGHISGTGCGFDGNYNFE